MNNKTFQLYLDQNDHWLGYVDSNGDIQHVRTDVQIDIDHIRITDGGFLQILNKGTWEDIKNDEGSLVSLKGPKGDTGETGPQGPQGEQGLQGRPSIFKGTISTPTDMDNKIAEGAQIGDSYIISGVDDSIQLPIDERNGSIFTVIDDEGRWDYSGNIRGPQGDSITITEMDDSDASRTVITFSDNSKLTVLNGKNGINGRNGYDGTSVRLVNNLSDLILQPAQTGDSCILTENDYNVNTGETVEAGSMYEYNGNAWVYKFSIKGPKGDNGIDGQNGENPFTEEEVQTLKELPNTLNDLQGQNVSQFQTISEQIKEVSDNLNYANAQNAEQFGRVHSRIDALEAKLTALEQTLQNIDLSGLAVAYPISTEE